MKVPDVLYKYFPKVRVDVLNNLKIRFTPPKQFNDPFEFLPRIEDHDVARLTEASSKEMTIVLQSLLLDYGELIPPDIRITKDKTTVTDENIEFLRRTLENADHHLIERLRNSLDKAIGVLSLSASKSNPLMWSHYSENHTGFVVGFRTENLWTSARSKHIDGPMKVNYIEKRPVTSVFDTNANPWFLSKQSIWKYEKEYRYIASLSCLSANHLNDFRNNDVTEIIAGLQTPEELKKQLCRIRDTSFPNASFLYSQITEDEDFRITFAE